MTNNETVPPKDIWSQARKVESGWVLLVSVIVLIVILVVTNPELYGNMLDFVKDGIGVTLYVTIISFVLVIIVGLIGGLGRISKNIVLRGISTVYVEVIRGIPLMVQLLYWYFAMPSIIQSLGRAIGNETLANYQTNAIVMAIVGLVVCYGAYMSEVVRAGIQSVPQGQMEAARSLGMTQFQAMQQDRPAAGFPCDPACNRQRVHHATQGFVPGERGGCGRPYPPRPRIQRHVLQDHPGVEHGGAAVPGDDAVLSARLVSFTEKATRTEK